MFEYITGKLVSIKDDYIVLENGGIGYKIFTSSNSLANLEIDKIVTMYIHFNLREDGVFLYGFVAEDELYMFNMLRLVSKIGPKVALSVLSTLTVNQIKSAILNSDDATLCNVPGIGKKTASRVILELKDRLKDEIIVDDKKPLDESNDLEIALQGMVSLGYTRGEVLKAIKNLDVNQMNTEEIIREALKRLSK